MASSGEHVRFAGPCVSACTIFLRLNKICITPEASFGFHSPYIPVSKMRDHEWTNVLVPEAARWLFNQYPEWVQDWIREKGGLKADMIWMDFETAKQHIKVCK
jgi:hypothetical protein